MAASRECEIPELFPQPKIIQFLEGISELAFDVRLDTSNVLPIQRKAVRTILGGVGVRVIANKKKFVVRARVEEKAAFDLQAVPENCRRDYYELVIQNSEVILRTPCQDGMVWAAQTLASLFRLVRQGRKLPNLKIQDWSETPVRGLYLDCAPGVDRMALNDWYQVVDVASALKLNLLGVGIYSCADSDFSEDSARPYECLMVPLGEQDDEHVFISELETETPHHLRWFNVQAEMWRDEEYLPAMQQQNFLKDLVAYGHERGIRIMPSVQFSRMSRLFSRQHPEFAAVDGSGNPLPGGCCYQSPALKEYCEVVFTRFLERYFHGGSEFFQLCFDDVQEEVPDCCCEHCRALQDGPRWLDFAVWLIGCLKSYGVERVVLTGRELLCAGTASALLAALRREDLLSDIVFHPSGQKECSGCSGDGEVETWLAPMMRTGRRLSYSNCRSELRTALLAAEEKQIPGVVFQITGDPACMDQLALLGCAAWEGKKEAAEDERIQKHWSQLQFAAGVNSYQEAVRLFTGLTENPLLLQCVPSFSDRPGTGDFPGGALRKIMESGKDTESIRAEFAGLSETALKIVQEMDKLLVNDSLGFALKDCLESFRQDAALFAVWMDIFSLLAAVRSAEEARELRRSLADKARDLRQRLIGVMGDYQEKKASWMMPRVMQPVSEMMVFLEQLAADITTAANGKDIPLRWQLEENWFETLEK